VEEQTKKQQQKEERRRRMINRASRYRLIKERVRAEEDAGERLKEALGSVFDE
jgi:hypothetical protein